MLGSKTPASFSGDLFDNQKIENLQGRGTEYRYSKWVPAWNSFHQSLWQAWGLVRAMLDAVLWGAVGTESWDTKIE